MDQNPIPKKKSRKKWVVVGVLLVIVIMIGVVMLSPKTTNLVTPGKLVTLSAGQYYSVYFTSTSSGTISGQINATNGITVYIMNKASYNVDVNASSFSNYAFTSGKVSGGSFNTNLATGTWYVVFVNSNLLTSSSVDIISLKFTS